MIYVALDEKKIIIGFYSTKTHGQKKCDSVIESGGIKIHPQIWNILKKWYKAKFIGVYGLEEYSLSDFEEIKEIIEEVEIPKTQIEILEEQVQVLTTENAELKKMDTDLVNLQWDMDYRVCEIEWTLEEVLPSPVAFTISNINTKGGEYKMALSRFEQAQIVILSGDYDRTRMEMQLANYLKRNYITQAEYDTLISMMDANDLISK